jgi:excisionase family DNA binding protein
LSDNDNKPLLTVKEVAARLRVSEKFLYTRCRAGQFPHIKIASEYRFDEDAVNAFLAENTVSPV